MMKRLGLLAVTTAVFLAAGNASNASAEDFYKDKTIRVTVGLAPGGGYDTYARAIARHIGKHTRATRVSLSITWRAREALSQPTILTIKPTATAPSSGSGTARTFSIRHSAIGPLDWTAKSLTGWRAD